MNAIPMMLAIGSATVGNSGISSHSTTFVQSQVCFPILTVST
ncbi:glycosylphosphatidylinositol transamidase (GPIT) subunit GPI8 [Methanohalophilus levihalophilus]|nr:glycosylphosphatidylinositol transamidase (GPIT) subunit GPI8 [Methanohalophilus levihalophilus]